MRSVTKEIVFLGSMTCVWKICGEKSPFLDDKKYRPHTRIFVNGTFGCLLAIVGALLRPFSTKHYSDVIMSAMASQITGISIVCSTVCSGADHRKHQSSASLAFVMGIDRCPVDSPQTANNAEKIFI